MFSPRGVHVYDPHVQELHRQYVLRISEQTDTFEFCMTEVCCIHTALQYDDKVERLKEPCYFREESACLQSSGSNALILDVYPSYSGIFLLSGTPDAGISGRNSDVSVIHNLPNMIPTL